MTMIGLPTGYWHELVAAGEAIAWPDRLRVVNVAGEAMRQHAVAQWLDRAGANVLLSNTYGPTEVTVNATATFVTSPDPDDPPIGRPVWNTWAYVLEPRSGRCRPAWPVSSSWPGRSWPVGTGAGRI